MHCMDAIPLGSLCAVYKEQPGRGAGETHQYLGFLNWTKKHEPEMENRERRNAQKEQQDKDMGSRPQSTEFDSTGQNKDRNVLRGLADATDNWG